MLHRFRDPEGWCFRNAGNYQGITAQFWICPVVGISNLASFNFHFAFSTTTFAITVRDKNLCGVYTACEQVLRDATLCTT